MITLMVGEKVNCEITNNDSEAVLTIIKNTKICASLTTLGFAIPTGDSACIFENATNKRFTEFNISSMHINTMMALRLVSTPIIPMLKRIRLK